MRRILLVVGVLILSTLHYFWPHFPYIGIAAGFGYACGAERWRNLINHPGLRKPNSPT